MTARFVVSGTDTDVGKTIFAAALTAALDGFYWKPVQAGLEGETDSDIVRRLGGVPPDRILPERYRLSLPASPHKAARADNILIDADALTPPATARPLVIEGAGGLLVPLTPYTLQIDLFARWSLPVILCARTSLGTINHTLLSVESLRHRNVPLHGIAFIGDENTDSESIIIAMSGARRLGRLPKLATLTPETLRAAFAAGFDIADFGGAAR
ncbi:MAG: dethiobiotin synthase [Pseudorhodoplanes sp.]